MKFTDEAVEAVAKALNPDLWAEESLVPEVLRHSARWQKRHDVRAALLAASPHLTDDGAADTPPAGIAGVGAPSAAESATATVAPSSPHLADEAKALREEYIRSQVNRRIAFRDGDATAEQIDRWETEAAAWWADRWPALTRLGGAS